MVDTQIRIWINIKYSNIMTEFKNEITKLEGGYCGYLGDYVADAIQHYTEHMQHTPEKIGRERYTNSNLSKTQQRTNDFIEHFGESLKPIAKIGLDYNTFSIMLMKFFKKSTRTVKTYENDIINLCQWSIINIPKTSKKIVLHRSCDLYGHVERFDETLNNYYSGLRPRKDEDIVFAQIRERLLPKQLVPEPSTAETDVDKFFSDHGGIKE